MRLSAATLLFVAASGSAASVEEDVRCLATSEPKNVQLEWHTFQDARTEWLGGYVRYKGASRTIPIVLASTRVISRPAGRPWEFRYTWLEISGGGVSGQYELSSQGANVYDFLYKNLRRSGQLAFTKVSSPGEDGQCKWE